MSPILFLDNDVILKLVACNLFWEAVAALGATSEDLRVLSDAQYVFRKSRKLLKKYPETIRNDAILIVEGCTKIHPEFSKELQDLEVEGIDPGERLLIAATQTEALFYLVTGDKRCLKALAAAPQLVEIRQRLSGRFVCLEQLILKLIKLQGVDEVLGKILPARDYDKALASIFGSGEQSTLENVSFALSEYIEDLRRETDNILADI